MVRLISMAMTGYYRTMQRPRAHQPLSMLKYDPIGTPTPYIPAPTSNTHHAHNMSHASRDQVLDKITKRKTTEGLMGFDWEDIRGYGLTVWQCASKSSSLRRNEGRNRRSHESFCSMEWQEAVGRARSSRTTCRWEGDAAAMARTLYRRYYRAQYTRRDTTKSEMYEYCTYTVPYTAWPGVIDEFGRYRARALQCAKLPFQRGATSFCRPSALDTL